MNIEILEPQEVKSLISGSANGDNQQQKIEMEIGVGIYDVLNNQDESLQLINKNIEQQLPSSTE